MRPERLIECSGIRTQALNGLVPAAVPDAMGDRRKYPRAYIAATVSVFRMGAHIGDYLAQNLSAGGALLVGGPPIEPDTKCSTIVRILGEYVLELDAVATRQAATNADHASLALRFEHRTPEAESAVQASVLRALTRAKEGSVLIVHCSPSDLVALAESVLAGGRRPILALTPLEAVRWLCDPESSIDAAIIGDASNADQSSALLQVIRDDFPRVRRVLVDNGTHQLEMQRILASNGVQAVLTPPWTPSVMDFLIRRDIVSSRMLKVSDRS